MDRRKAHKLRNLLHTVLLMAGMAAIVGVCAWSLFGPGGVFWSIVGVIAALFFAPAVSTDAILRMYRARPLHPANFPQGVAVTEILSQRAGLSHVPRLYYLPSRVMNAFAVGRPSEAAIALSDGLIRGLNERELACVIAHEISHVENGDLTLMMMADIMARVTSVFAHVGLFLLILNLPLALMGAVSLPWALILVLVFAPTFVSLLQLALSRAREFDADLDAASLTGDPLGLASALAKLERRRGRFWEEIFLPARRIPEPSLLRTHPPTEERISRLMELRDERRFTRQRQGSVPQTGFIRTPRPLALTTPMGGVRRSPRYRWPGVWY
ncbi:MAG: zinc metalloprotease HtpX [Geminicoccaceae bacterium]